MEKKKKVGNVKRILHYYWLALMQFKIRFIFLLILVPVWIFVSNVVVPYGTSQIIGKLSSGDFDLQNYLGVLLITLAPAMVNNLFVVRVIDWLDWSLDALGGEFLAKKAFAAVINQSMTFHSNKFSGSLTSAANKLSSAFISLKSNFTWSIYPLILTAVFSIGVAAFVCAPFALILAIFVIIYMAVAITTYYKTRYVDEKMAKAENKQTGQLADAITNEMSVKSYAHENLEMERFSRATTQTRRAIFRTAKVSMWRNLSMNVVNMITYAGLLILIVLSHNMFGLSVADMVFLYSLSNSLLNNVWTINHILRAINRSLGDAKEMVEILDTPLIVDDKTEAK